MMRTVLRMCLLVLGASLALLQGDARADAAKESSDASRVRLIRRWSEPITLDGKTTLGHVEILFDYDQGVAIERLIDHDGKVISTNVHKKGQGAPGPTAQEIREAKEFVRGDEELGRIIARTGAQLQGGFILNEPVGHPCEPGTRCIQIKLNTADGIGFIRWAVVDMTKMKFAYRSYMPSTGEGQ
jgi:hypothetical protein